MVRLPKVIWYFSVNYFKISWPVRRTLKMLRNSTVIPWLWNKKVKLRRSLVKSSGLRVLLTILVSNWTSIFQLYRTHRNILCSFCSSLQCFENSFNTYLASHISLSFPRPHLLQRSVTFAYYQLALTSDAVTLQWYNENFQQEEASTFTDPNTIWLHAVLFGLVPVTLDCSKQRTILDFY